MYHSLKRELRAPHVVIGQFVSCIGCQVSAAASQTATTVCPCQTARADRLARADSTTGFHGGTVSVQWIFVTKDKQRAQRMAFAGHRKDFVLRAARPDHMLV